MTAARTKPKRSRTGRGSTEAARTRNEATRTRAGAPPRRSKQAGHAPRQLIVVTCVSFLVALGLLAWDLTDSWRNAPPSVGGQIAMPVAGGINLVDTGSGRSKQLFAGEANASVTAIAWSPDRSMLAYTLFHRRAEDRVSSAELFTIPASGGSPTLVVPRPQPGTVIDAPAWSPDGASIFFAYQGVENSKPVARIERVGVADSSRQTLYTDAAFPAVAPDGRGLAFVYDNGTGQALRVGSVDGGDAREIVGPSVFQGVMGPRFSPDGAWIAFEAQGPGPSGDAWPGEAQPPAGGLAAFMNGFSVPVAEAHGNPWSVWKVRPDGRELQQVGSLQEDEPLLAWSKDGAWIAVHGTGGLWLVDVGNTIAPRRLTDGTIGGIDW